MFKRLWIVFDSIKIAHSIFALPFALVAMLVAAGGWPAWNVVAWIVVCMVSGRSAAMAFNRWADRGFDAANPRTATRPSVTGLVSPNFLMAFVLANAAVFLAAAWMLNPVCFYCAAPVLLILCGYSYAKRFTSLCHFWLGLSLGLAPLGAHLAVRGDLAPLPHLGQAWHLPFELFPLLLVAAVLCWVSGFDLIYACQDFKIDSADERLHSMPKALGIKGALVLSAVLHVLAAALLAGLGVYAGMGPTYYAAVAVVAGLLVYEHWIVRPDDLSRVNVAFFTLNGAVSLVLFAAVLLERVILNHG
ncbi:MAG: putative 4-hydroxybenzoate polyprenyltransferase [Planctomycetota bacterium]|nr:putative 4-hydroxybenzoate polyprenyltransferase [Planctomycetota bacterium]